MGALLQNEDLIPDLILCSSAIRTHKTALLVAEACTDIRDIKQTRELYQADPQDYVDVLRHVADKHTRVLVVGHNPGVEMLIEALTGEATSVPTAALAYIELPLKHWRELDTSTECKLVYVWRAKKLG